MLRQIQYFQAIARTGSFTEAAEECYISQSAISQQLQALETELGVQLINREKRKISLTPAGKYFYDRSLLLTADFEKLCRETVKIAHEDHAELRIGYLRGYGGLELQLAVAAFTQKYPDVAVQIVNGNHEDLYEMIRLGSVDLVFNDQRRAFNEDYVNDELTETECYIEVSGHSAFAKMDTVDIAALRDTPCIIVSSKEQQENEKAYYHDFVGFQGEFVYAENLEEARLLVLSGRGIMPMEGTDHTSQLNGALCRIPLRRNGKKIHRKYCAFWKKDNSGYYVEEFAELLEKQFK